MLGWRSQRCLELWTRIRLTATATPSLHQTLSQQSQEKKLLPSQVILSSDWLIHCPSISDWLTQIILISDWLFRWRRSRRTINQDYFQTGASLTLSLQRDSSGNTNTDLSLVNSIPNTVLSLVEFNDVSGLIVIRRICTI